MEIRNIAIIAHVDHGKTTLVDALLKAGGAFEDYQHIEERVMDSNDLEKERGITIYAKNAAITYKDTKINIVDTPGHADFGSEVERVLRTVDATLLLIDAAEGPMPQTKFVLKKSLELGLKVLVIINKIDKPLARPDAVIDATFDLFASLGANDKQLDFPYIYAIAKQGIAIRNLNDEKKDITPLLDFILENVKTAEQNIDTPFRMQPASLAYNNYLGRIAIGRVYEGQLKSNQNVFILGQNGEKRQAKASKVFTFKGLKQVEVEGISAGDIVAIAGIPDIYVGETISTDENAEALPAIKIDPPALAMEFMVNDSPFAGSEGKYVTSRHIKERLERELESNVGLKIEFSPNNDSVKVYGRGELHLAVLIENMRREGYELQVSQPKVIMQEINGVKNEPIEFAIINVPDNMAGKIIELMSKRKGQLKNMKSENSHTSLEFEVPTRGLLAFHSVFTLLTRGEGTFYHAFDHFEPYKGEIDKRTVGSMISGENGSTMAYSLWKLQERGPLFVHPATEIYEGMIIGEHNQGTDIVVNATKNKKLTNMRASGSDEALALVTPIEMTLEKALEYIKDDEYVEITPKNIRLRKKFLTEIDRKRQGRQ
ncbi:MAG: GTP-binding protein TypA, GTP-binding protein [Candidatus Peregrinibacteria bacterium GW2011_GWF2_33_10]|nr:MAG: GTP-binding protein TypA, GTP-binding protein [Candidatus Peregrinibacteria bacterium GW2011_GWF2_33_10]OGJ45139.1 MAG: GTP-binding protein TypA [Candidatus Peregrinibacteria bacterium RIFOXYA2_FULL_33_21]OGJ46332.1 MAG: GTP-binding protein TypA [Candidatus Peregrinibacteria bacterium RIFOXYA12_FULL_33_12]OGJ50808.1 MAG: GTP-binding protein TypA [Candidatus Peregrinibacteria bacterium RIFOXYB2_FULL_33_20]